ncbi:MAG: DUF4838 domain-containing protein [Armatimonadetes bacterium]|nr:DUF4838 domain-containing protein [Armatimonadota bacterium]
MTSVKPSEGATLTIAQGGKSDYIIVIPANASPSEERAGRELQRFLLEITGARLPILRDDVQETNQGKKTIALGNSRLFQESGATADFKSLGEEGFALVPMPPHLFIVGSPKRGTMYGVYSFLEDDLGCRWYSARARSIPKKRSLKVAVRERTEIPAFEYREPFYSGVWDKDFAARNRINGTTPLLDASTGGKVAYGPFVHTFYALVPPKEYFEPHPEYFSLINGARKVEGGQLCLTNPDVLRIATERMRRWMREQPEAVIFSVSQNDWTGPCECENCRKVVEEEGAESGPVLRFANAVAERIEKDFPDRLIDTLAYWYTEDPPRYARPRPNVRVRLAPIGACFAHPFGTCDQNRKQLENLQAWAKITDQLYIWHYATNFAHYLQPFPNLDELGEGVRIYKENGTKGLFYQGNHSKGGGGEFNEMRAWVIAKMMWNPYRDYWKTVDDFIQGYYGKAAPHIRRYLSLMHEPFRGQPSADGADTRLHLHIFEQTNAPYLTKERLLKADRIFEAAEKAVQEYPEFLERVRHARLSIEYIRLQQSRPRYAVEGAAYKPVPDPETARLQEIVVSKIKRAGITNVHEWNPVQEFFDRLEKGPQEYTAASLRSSGLQVDIVPELGGRIVRVQPTGGKNLLTETGRTPESPADGGYEEYAFKGYRSAGWKDAFTVAEASDTAAVLEASLPGDIKARRTFRLEPEKPILSVETTYQNSGSEPLVLSPRAHPEFQAAQGSQYSWVDGTDCTQSLPVAGQGERILAGSDRPDGSVKLACAKGKTLTLRFSPEAVEQVSLDWDADASRANIELIAPDNTIAPGESVSLGWELAVE